jgi:hypothetical protein
MLKNFGDDEHPKYLLLRPLYGKRKELNTRTLEYMDVPHSL